MTIIKMSNGITYTKGAIKSVGPIVETFADYEGDAIGFHVYGDHGFEQWVHCGDWDWMTNSGEAQARKRAQKLHDEYIQKLLVEV